MSLPLLLFVVLVIQILFFLILLTAFLVPSTRHDRASVSVSILVCARNEEKNLQALIPLLLGQKHPDFEVIVVNDRSTDGTRELLKRQSQANPRLRFINIDILPAGWNGKKNALSQGIKLARNEVVLLTDADCKPVSANWANNMTLQFDDRCEIVLGYSPYLKTSGLLNTFIRFETLLTGIQFAGLARIGLPYMGTGRNLAYRRSFFLEHGGFDGLMDVTGGDDDLWVNRHATRTNTRIRLGRESLVYSVPEVTWKLFLNQKLRHLSVGVRYRTLHRLLLGLFHGSLILSWFLGIACLVYPGLTFTAVSAIGLRFLILTGTIVVASRQFGDKFSPWPVMFLDFLYVIYYISTGLRALLAKKIQWTT